MGRIAVHDRHEPVRPDEDRVRVVPEVEQLEAGAPLGLLAADALAEVDPRRLDVRPRLDQLHGRNADLEEL